MVDALIVGTLGLAAALGICGVVTLLAWAAFAARSRLVTGFVAAVFLAGLWAFAVASAYAHLRGSDAPGCQGGEQ